jgi:feruloyl esterase
MNAQLVRLAATAVLLAQLYIVPAACAQDVSPAATETASASCKALESVDFSGIPDAPTQITEAKLVEASGVVPAHCLAKGYITSHVGIELRMPIQNWNGKFMEVGCGGDCGVFFTQLCRGPLRKGYACIASDMGHTSLTNQALWAYNNLQAQVDWGYRAAHVTAIAGKAITHEYYSREPARSYFLGCSTGGREALVESQRFPWDFDGIVAGAPVVNSSGWTMDVLWGIKSLTGRDGNPILSNAEAKMLHEAVIAKCDMDDGVKDGIISNPKACKFDPAVLRCKPGAQASCLTDEQINAVKQVYAGPPPSIVDRVYSEGATPGSELTWVSDFLSYWSTSHYMADLFRYSGFWPAPGPTWKLADFDYGRDYKRIGMYAALANANNPDLRKFAAVGGKLLVYFGWTDVSPPEATDYYETVERTMGGRAATQNFFRLFMIPGMDHCTGGAGAFAIDYLSYMEAWVEKGQAPDKLIGAHINGLAWGDAFGLPFPLDAQTPIAFTRPIYPYPIRAKYKGNGDPNDATNFVPVTPR